MPEIQQNTLYLTTPASYVARDHLTLQVEVPLYPDDLPPAEHTRERASDWKKLSIPIHMLESICVFGPSTISPPALDLCWEHGVAVNYLSEHGYLQARMTGVADTSVTLRRAQFRAADDAAKCAAIARQIIAGKLQNSRISLLRAARETDSADERARLTEATDALARQIQELGRWTADDLRETGALDALRGTEGMGSATYFGVFTLLLKQQREDFTFANRSRRPPRDRMNALLSFLYSMLMNDCRTALESVGLDPQLGYLHTVRPGRAALALDLMEEFRSIFADRLALTLVNRKQIQADDFDERPGGAVQLHDAARKALILAYQERKQELTSHPLLDQKLAIGLLPQIQARLLARVIRGEAEDYLPYLER